MILFIAAVGVEMDKLVIHSLKEPFSFPEPTICSVSGGIVGLWYQPLPDVVNFTTSGSACLIR